MTFMPAFIQTATEISPTDHRALEADLLGKRSRQCLSQLLNILDSNAPPKSVYTTRLNAELQIVENNGYSGYFLIVADYVQWAKDNGIAVGPGRGSGPCSLIGFVLGITKVDPIKYTLPFERFVNPDRNSHPDFDLDFCDERRNEVTAYLQSKYGSDRVAQLSSEADIPLASRLVICDRPLAKVIPLHAETGTSLPTAKITTAQVTAAGLVQFNVINQKAITINQRAVQLLAQSGKTIDLDHIELDHALTYQLLGSGEPSTIIELDSDRYKAALIAIKPSRFSELYATIALCYPGMNSYIPSYVQRKNNQNLIQPAHPVLEAITSDTYGLILYQEQFIYIAHKVAGFSLAESDSFHRALKKAVPGAAQRYKQRFISGSIESGLSQTDAETLFAQLDKLSNRVFNKSHAVAYAMITYQTAWLKVNYPQQYSEARTATAV